MLAIHARGVRKTYEKNGVEALGGVDLEVRPAEIFCLLGPNGAGKTTLVRILATQLEPGGGEIEILGFDLRREATAIRRRLATVPQFVLPEPGLKVWEQISYYLVARGAGWREARRATREITDQLGLQEKYDERISHLSGGMARRVILAMALASPSQILFLDEPTAGLDVVIRRETWRLLAQLKREKTILLTTHSMEEAEALSDRVSIINRGRIVVTGTPRELRALAPGRQKVVVAEDSIPRDRAEALANLRPYAGNWALYTVDDEATRRLLALAVEHKAEASVLNATLEDAYIHLVAGNGDHKLEQLR